MEKVLGPITQPDVVPVSTEERDQYHYAFDLAYFLHPNKHIAAKIAAESIIGLPDTYSAQARRTEYTPKGAFRTRISMQRNHLLQRRVFAASVPFERRREKSGRITAE